MRTPTTLRFGAAVMLVSSLGGCVVGPNYQRPTAPVSATFKEADGWKPSQPADGIDRGAWWSIYNDPVLDQLERKVAISNQNIAAAEAAYRQARALTAEARSEYFPVISGQATAERSKRGGVVSVSGDNLASPGSTTSNTFNGQLGATWAVDLWGRIRRTVEENREAAQSAAADIASARLSAQTELAVDYFSLRVNDAQKVLLDDTIKNYQRALDITQNQYDAGVAAKADVITAQTQVQNAQASAVDLGVQRAAYEHAIAMLIGAPPAELTIAFAPAPRDVPVAPLNVASTLLERRPDIAVAERSMASANAGIGVAVSAYYPDLTLSGAFGYSSSKLSNLFRASNQLWSFGPSLADNLIDFGARKAQVQQAPRDLRPAGGPVPPDRAVRLPGRRGPDRRPARARTGSHRPRRRRGLRPPGRATGPQPVPRRPGQLHHRGHGPEHGPGQRTEHAVGAGPAAERQRHPDREPGRRLGDLGPAQRLIGVRPGGGPQGRPGRTCRCGPRPR